jgi:hypothetical protein
MARANLTSDSKSSSSTPSAAVNSTVASNSTGCDQETAGNGFMGQGIRVFGKANMQVFGYLANAFRDDGGNEMHVGKAAARVDATVEKKIGGKYLDRVYADISYRNSPLTYGEEGKHKYQNEHYYRAEGFYNQPGWLASIGTEFHFGDNHVLNAKLGSMQVSGIDPLGKTSDYYATTPTVIDTRRFDNAIRLDYRWKDNQGDLIKSHFAVIDGEWMQGQSSVIPSDYRANSYPGYAAGVEIRGVSLYDHLVGGNLRDKAEVYGCVERSDGDAGSYPGKKRKNKNTLRCVGTSVKVGDATISARYTNFNTTQNPAGDGSGSHTDLVNTKGKALELHAEGLHAAGCDWDAYISKDELHNMSALPDGVYTVAGVRNTKGHTVGLKCRNIGGVKGLHLGAELSKRKLDDPRGANTGTWCIDHAGSGCGRMANIFVEYEFDFDKNIRFGQ